MRGLPASGTTFLICIFATHTKKMICFYSFLKIKIPQTWKWYSLSITHLSTGSTAIEEKPLMS